MGTSEEVFLRRAIHACSYRGRTHSPTKVGAIFAVKRHKTPYSRASEEEGRGTELHGRLPTQVAKEYLSKVVGEFPSRTDCRQPISKFNAKHGYVVAQEVDGVTPKEAVTEFELVSSDGGTSVVLCRPKTGLLQAASQSTLKKA